MAILLRLWGYEVRTATNGPGALRAVEGYSPDIVLLDVAMPGMDGYEVARRLRQRLGRNAAVVVTVSGYGQECDVLRSREAGCDHHLLKPVAPEELEVLLSLWSPQARGAAGEGNGADGSPAQGTRHTPIGP
jgi:CheY-like chemotaxis protein